MALPQSRAATAEVRKFDALADRWWDPAGPMRELHRMNPLRTRWIGERIAARFGEGGVRLLDVGCGAGIASEVFARGGHAVTGIDAAPAAIQAARDHAAGGGLTVAYRVAETTALLADGETFQVVTALEVIEHVPDPGAFLRDLARLVAPGGLVFVSTINRTPRSFATAIVGAEYLARLLPRGTHDWRRFLTPAELSRHFRAAGLRLSDIAGMTPNLAARTWRESRDTQVNYIAMGESQAPRTEEVQQVGPAA